MRGKFSLNSGGRLVAFAILSFFVAGCAFWEIEERPADLTLTELENKRQEASDPSGVYRKANSYVQKQVITVPKTFTEQKYLVEIKYQRPDCFKMTTVIDNRPVNSIIFNGSKAWQVDYKNKTITPITGTTFNRLKMIFDMSCPDSTFANLFKDVKLTECTIDHVDYYKLHCIPEEPGMEPFDIFINKASFLLKRLETSEKINGKTYKFTSIMNTYSLYEDVMVPQTVTSMVNDATENSEVVYYKLNAIIDPDEFLPPKF